MERGAECWVTILSQRIDQMLLLEIFYFLDTIIIIMKRKEKPTGGGMPETHTYANR